MSKIKDKTRISSKPVYTYNQGYSDTSFEYGYKVFFSIFQLFVSLCTEIKSNVFFFKEINGIKLNDDIINCMTENFNSNKISLCINCTNANDLKNSLNAVKLNSLNEILKFNLKEKLNIIIYDSKEKVWFA